MLFWKKSSSEKRSQPGLLWRTPLWVLGLLLAWGSTSTLWASKPPVRRTPAFRKALAKARSKLGVPAKAVRKKTREQIEVAKVAAFVDAWHRAASQANGEAYFGAFTEAGVFLGTDESERWSVEEFRAYAEPYFSKGKGWTYKARDRHVQFDSSYRFAWLDEKLSNSSMGSLRGTAVLQKLEGRWKIAHYSMSFPLPNERTREVVELLREDPKD